MKKLLLIVLCLISNMLFGQTATAPSVGDGTAGAPYQIASLNNLYWIAENSSRWGYHYIQTSNIDASETVNWFSNGAGGYYGWTPIGNWTNKFSGVYDGNGHIIDSLYINRPDVQYLGLFGATGGATILKVGVTNVNISGYLRIGAVVGCTDNNTIVKLCFSTGILAGTSNFIGGLVGDNRYSTISDCYSRANVSGYWSNGSLIGENAWSSVNNCYSTGTAQGGSTGGLIGYNYQSPVGNSFWDTQTSGLTTSAGGTGKTTAEMKVQTTFTDSGWNFTSVWEIIANKNDGYPVLQWESLPPAPLAPLLGDGSTQNPYQIATLENLYWIAADNSKWNKHYIQIADIDASSTSNWSGGGWIPIGNDAIKFNGSYNGNGHTIDGLYINRGGTDHQGLFGYTNSATISNLGVTNVNINTYRKVGAVAGNIENTTIMNCYSSGNISGSFIIGSLVGITYYSTVTNCYSKGSVSGETTIGGLVGYNYTGSNISNCYSSVNIPGSHSTIGGLVGSNWNASVSNSFWDVEVSGQLNSSAGTGKTTAEMKTNSTYLNAGWNPEIWKRGDGINEGYPYLVWQNPNGTSLFQTPILTSPLNNSIGISIPSILNWSAVSGADKYRLEVNTQSDFGGTIIFNADTLNDTMHTITELLNDFTYFWRVTGLNNYGYSSDTSSTFGFTTKLSTVTLSSPANNSKDISLTPILNWAVVSGADRYRLEVNTQPDFAGTIIFDQDTINLTSKKIGGLTDNTEYYWRVTALNNSGNSSDTSSTFNFTTKKTVLSFVSDGATAVSTSPILSWNSIAGVSKYRLEVNASQDFTGLVVFDNSELADTVQNLIGLENNTNYYWRVTASSNVLLKTNTSEVYSFTTKLSTPTLAAPINNSSDVSLTPTLSWSIVPGADKYRLEVNSQSDFNGTIIFDQDTINLSSKQIGGLTDNKEYYWRVTALNNASNSSDTSSTFSFLTKQAVLSSVSDGAKAVSTSPILSWDKTLGASKYRLEVNTSQDFAGLAVFDNSELVDTIQNLIGLENNTTYYWRVTASSNVLLKTNTSEVYSFTTKLSTPTLATPINNSNDVSLTPTLSWSNVAGADKYRLEINTKSDFSGMIILDEDTLSRTSHKIGVLLNDSTYFWRVTALSNSGNVSDKSTTFSFTTEKLTGIEISKDIAPNSYAAYQNYPNPFNPTTAINYQLPVSNNVTLKVYDLLGNEVATLVDEHKSAGRYEVKFDASNLSSGIYFYKLQSGSFVETKKMILLK